MSQEALLSYITEHPDDDSARLVYADWLDENGNPDRAEFIRLQLRFAHSEAPRWDDETGFDRMRDLEQRHANAWRAAPPSVPGVHYCSWFKRGFQDTLSVRNLGAFIAHASELFAATPVSTLILEGLTTEAGKALAGVPEMARLRGLRFDGVERITIAGLRRLANSPHLIGLKELDLHDHFLTAGLLDVLERAPWRLEALLMSAEYAPGVCPEGLLRSSAVEKLRVLNLNNRRVGAAAVEAIEENLLLRQLRCLYLDGCDLTDRCADFLAAADHLENLITLSLSRNQLGSAGAGALAQASWFGRLTSLDLAYNPIGPAGALALASAPKLPALTSLDLSDCRLDPASIVVLAESGLLDNVRALSLDRNDLGALGARALAKPGRLKRLRHLAADSKKLPEAERRMMKERFGEALTG